MNIVNFEMIYFPDSTTGKPVSNGSVYVGEPDTDPEVLANQKTVTVREEDGTETAVSQPIKTGGGGVPLYNGSPVQLLVDGDYSLKVLDSNGAQVYYVDSAINLNPASQTAILIRYGTLADLQGGATYTGAIAYLAGYSTEGDGGEGVFRWDGTDLSGKVSNDTQSGIYVPPDFDVTGSSGAWVRQYSGEINVKWFGAKGDEATDDTTAINAALAMVGTDESTKVLFPSGTYLISSTITWPSLAKLRGEGERSSIIKANAATTMLRADGGFRDSGGHDFYRGEIVDLRIDGNNIATKGVYITGGSWLVVDSARFRGFNSGPAFEAEELWDSYFIDTYWIDNTYTSTAALRLLYGNGDNCNNIRFFGCTWEKNEGGAIESTGGTLTDERNTSIDFFGCKIEDAGIGTKNGINAQRTSNLRFMAGFLGVTRTPTPATNYIGKFSNGCKGIMFSGSTIVYVGGDTEENQTFYIEDTDNFDIENLQIEGNGITTPTVCEVGTGATIYGSKNVTYNDVLIYPFSVAPSNTVNTINDLLKIISSGGDASITVSSSGDMQVFRDGVNKVEITETVNDLSLNDYTRVSSGAWDGSLMLLGSYRLWVDATGDLRIKDGDPVSDTDGTIVGTQS